MARTPRYGLTAVGPNDAMDGKFTFDDRYTIDRLLAAAEVHDHSGGTKLADPSRAPLLTLNTGGTIGAGVTLYYRVSFLDANGMETAASQEATVTTPPPVRFTMAPEVEARATVTGTLKPGHYFYALTGHVDGIETQLSPATLFEVLPDRSAAIIRPEAPLPAGMTGYSVWRKAAGADFYSRLTPTPVAPTVTEWHDTGYPADACACDPASQPPTVNLTNASNVVTIEVPDHERVLAEGLRWRIYRSTQSGYYPAASLLAQVDAATAVADPANPGALSPGAYFYDYGDLVLQPGVPLELSQVIEPSKRLQSVHIDHVTPDLNVTTVSDEFGAIHTDLATAQADIVELKARPAGGAMEPGTYFPMVDRLPSQEWQLLAGMDWFGWETQTTDPAADATRWKTLAATWAAYSDYPGLTTIHGWTYTVTADGYVELLLPSDFPGGNVHFSYDVAGVNGTYGNGALELHYRTGPRLADGTLDWSVTEWLWSAGTEVGWTNKVFYVPAGAQAIVFPFWGASSGATTGTVRLTAIRVHPLGVDSNYKVFYFKPTGQLLAYDQATNSNVDFYVKFPPPEPRFTSPNGAIWGLRVDNAGALSTTLVRAAEGMDLTVRHSADLTLLECSWTYVKHDGTTGPNNFTLTVYNYTTGARGAQLDQVGLFGDARAYNITRAWRTTATVSFVEVELVANGANGPIFTTTVIVDEPEV